MPDVTQVLSQIEQGDPSTAEQLLPLVYAELRKLAAQKMAQENPGQTFHATALVHQAYIRLVNVEKVQHWNSRGRSGQSIRPNPSGKWNSGCFVGGLRQFPCSHKNRWTTTAAPFNTRIELETTAANYPDSVWIIERRYRGMPLPAILC